MELNNEGYQETERKRSIFSSAVDAAMLSLLSLIIASGTVLRADTEQWEPTTYPDPRTNATGCNTVDNSTLCDPDRILTDTWRQTINENINRQTARLRNIDIHYTDEAPENCTLKNGSDVQIFVILARRISTTSNQNITTNDLASTEFGHKLRKAFGLDSQTCKDYIMILGVELAKELYVWVGYLPFGFVLMTIHSRQQRSAVPQSSDLLFPKDRLDTSLSQYKNMFLEKNYMEGLNKIVEEIVLTALISMTFLFAVLWKKYEIRIMFPYPTKKNDSTHGSVSEISLPRTVSLTGSNRLAYLQSADAYRLKKFDPQFQPPTSSGSLV
ncbi:unnamed protein product [Nippostrongylus brasiliensis]|uniref:Calcium permeable stress-gated cation channel 1 n=1 Tax=Nippostrongylus brasiliensis TaxID=27835 RepID=A0A0N4Y8Z4_NIPBR|nr:unnamed protein product [Nippostrongylus brasiliensis]